MAMNFFRLVADLMHLASILILIWKIQTSKSCAGISFKTQLLYAIVFVARYLDLFTHYVSLYLTSMKIFFIGSSFYILYLIQVKFKGSRGPQIDTFKIEYIIGTALLLALIFNYEFSFMEITWAFSIYLEAVAILPQLMMMQRTGEAETITTHYVFALGAYRTLYIVNWIYRWYFEDHYDYIAWVAGIVQSGLYADFFYIYFTKVLKGKRFELPA